MSCFYHRLKTLFYLVILFIFYTIALFIPSLYKSLNEMIVKTIKELEDD